MTQQDMRTPTHAELDEMVAELAAGAKTWAGMDLHERAQILRATQKSVAATAGIWAGAATSAKQVPSGSLEGEEWMSGPAAVAPMLGEYADTLHLLAHGRSAIEGRKLGTAPGGRVSVRILPGDLKDNLLFNGFVGEVWLQPGVTAEQAKADAGLGAKRVGENGGVGLVLGAGNISAIGPLDIAYELVAYNRVSILKLNPTFQHLLPVYEMALAPLIEAGLLRIVNGGAEVGGYLADHPGISHVHITGSGRTHDAIVWGPGDEGARNKAAGTPKLSKEMTSELGGVSPIIVVPGTWSKGDLRFQAEHVVTQRLHNAGHNCIGGQALILSADWDQKDAFLAEIRGVLEEITPRSPWYPNGQASIDRAKATYGADAEQVGSAVLVAMKDESPSELYDGEYFAAVLGITELPGTGADFLANAVDFANDRLDGTLGGSVIVHPKDIKAMGERFDELVAELKYGAVGINVWSGVAFLLGGATWGAYPGHTLDAVGSGIGVVHNTHLMDHVEKTVVSGPFHMFPASVLSGELTLAPRPPWFVTAKTSATVGKALAALAGKRTWLGVLKVVPPAMRG
ncbi:aldehyde dehydrogenase family protein [Nocardioides nematodiphilus]|uniref:aldehyde dehydrogenase family protein n=1 Tax=Nocardioides nematodiphilus TaxID=2849669 RepID=UPI001CD93EC1|nr:aldehyde dehydrogenase family protein [Nocardioides nematodiphilus]MCA1983377.1 aldehyde dehydrogenase family protein [Nocardioides nematodiphilus]